MSLAGTWAGEPELHAYSELLPKDDLIKVFFVNTNSNDKTQKNVVVQYYCNRKYNQCNSIDDEKNFRNHLLLAYSNDHWHAFSFQEI